MYPLNSLFPRRPRSGAEPIALPSSWLKNLIVFVDQSRLRSEFHREGHG
jgi:hypothetical protein